MKKIFFGTFSLLVTAFAYQGCAPVDNSKAMIASDSMAEARLIASRDSLMMVCMNDVMMAAKMRADTMMQIAMSSGGKKSYKKPATPPPPKSTGKLGEKLNEQSSGKLKDKLGASDTAKKSGKLKDKINSQPNPK